MNKFNKKSIFAIIGLVLVLAISLVFPFGTAFADYVEDVQTITNVIVDFNQLVVNNNINKNIVLSGDNYVYNVFSLVSGHQYYIRINNLSSVRVYLFYEGDNLINYFNTGYTDFIYNSQVTQSDVYLYGYNILAYENFNVIDLTQMFGSGNEPNLQQSEELFVAEFYAYTASTPVAYDTIDAYTNGVNAYLNSTEYVISSLGFLNSVYAVNLSNAYSAFESQVTRDIINNRVVVESGQSNVTPTLCLPFNYTIPTGTQITISGSCATTQYNASYRLHLGLWGNGGEMIVIPQSMQAGTQGHLITSTITFTLPMSVDRIYIMTSDDATWYLSNFEVGYYLTNVDILRELGYADGVKYMQEQYSPNGALYQSIYMKGYNAYPTEDHFTFQKLIYSVIDVPVQAFTNLFDYDILGVNMKTFYLSLFTLAVIITIIRLVL